MKRLVTNIPDWMKAFPFAEHPDSEISPLLIAEQFNPPRSYRVRCSDLLGVHKALGFIPRIPSAV